MNAEISSGVIEYERDVAGLMASLRAVGALVWPAPAYERSYRLLDFQFKLKTSTAFLDAETHQLLSRFAAPNDGSSGVVLEIVREDQQWLLLHQKAVVDRTPSPMGVIPMLHANVLLMAYEGSDCLAVLHAAAVTRRDQCVLMPAVSG